jgi:hypothetical protein
MDRTSASRTPTAGDNRVFDVWYLLYHYRELSSPFRPCKHRLKPTANEIKKTVYQYPGISVISACILRHRISQWTPRRIIKYLQDRSIGFGNGQEVIVKLQGVHIFSGPFPSLVFSRQDILIGVYLQGSNTGVRTDTARFWHPNDGVFRLTKQNVTTARILIIESLRAICKCLKHAFKSIQKQFDLWDQITS